MKLEENCDAGKGWKMVVFKPEFSVAFFQNIEEGFAMTLHHLISTMIWLCFIKIKFEVLQFSQKPQFDVLC